MGVHSFIHLIHIPLILYRCGTSQSRGVAPIICTSWKWEVRCITQPLDPREITLCIHCLRGWVGPKRCSGCYEEEGNQYPSPSIPQTMEYSEYALPAPIQCIIKLWQSVTMNVCNKGYSLCVCGRSWGQQTALNHRYLPIKLHFVCRGRLKSKRT